MELPGDPVPFLLVPLDHPLLEPLQLPGPVGQAPVQLGVSQGGTDLLSQGQQERVVQGREGIPGLPHHHQGTRHLLSLEDGQGGHVGMGDPRRRGLPPHLGLAGREHRTQEAGQSCPRRLSLPGQACAPGRYDIPLPEPHVRVAGGARVPGTGGPEEGSAPDRPEGHDLVDEGRGEGVPGPARLEFRRQGREGPESLVEVLLDQEEDAPAHRQFEEDVEVVAPGVPDPRARRKG